MFRGNIKPHVIWGNLLSLPGDEMKSHISSKDVLIFVPYKTGRMPYFIFSGNGYVGVNSKLTDM